MDEDNTKNSRILLIDDEESLRFTFEMFLKRAGYTQVTGVSTFEAALVAIDKNEFDCIISDIVLEGASGVDILRHIREAGNLCPVVLVTGYPNVETASEAVRLGAFDYLPKPVKKDNLLSVVNKALLENDTRKKQEKSYKENDQAFLCQNSILQSIHELIITVDLHHQVVDLNDKAREWLKGHAPEITKGVTLDALSGRLVKALLKDVLLVKATDNEVKEHRVEWVTDNTPAVLSVTAAPLKDNHGSMLGVVISARDVSGNLVSVTREKRLGLHRIVGASLPMQRLYALIESAGPVDTTVLITGESGTGKELVAEALHLESSRRERPLIKVDCASIPEELLESELFGHRKGAFTGADNDRLGRILQADGGTLFLDEIGDISPKMQLRLLRFLQQRVFYPVGRDHPIQVDVRVIAATNAILKQKIADGSFREDLYYRLCVVDIKLPSLRDRAEDIPLLAEHFLKLLDARMARGVKGFSGGAMNVLGNYCWPGNVRELEHVVERSYVLSPGNYITEEQLPQEIVSYEAVHQVSQPDGIVQQSVWASETDIEIDRIKNALRLAGGNKAKAARILGIDRSTIYRKMLTYNIDANNESVSDKQ